MVSTASGKLDETNLGVEKWGFWKTHWELYPEVTKTFSIERNVSWAWDAGGDWGVQVPCIVESMKNTAATFVLRNLTISSVKKTVSHLTFPIPVPILSLRGDLILRFPHHTEKDRQKSNYLKYFQPHHWFISEIPGFSPFPWLKGHGLFLFQYFSWRNYGHYDLGSKSF